MTTTQIVYSAAAGFSFYCAVGYAFYFVGRGLGFKSGHRAGFCRGYDLGRTDGIVAVWDAYSKRGRDKRGRFAPMQRPPTRVAPPINGQN